MKCVYALVLCLLVFDLIGQDVDDIRFDSTLYEFSNRINTSDIKNFLSVIASDSLEGRETGEIGQKKAAHFIASKMREYDITGMGDSLSYFQRFGLWSIPYDMSFMVAGKDTMKVLEDYYTFSPILKKSVKSDRLIFLGYGIEDSLYNNYSDINAKGKVGVIVPHGVLFRSGAEGKIRQQLIEENLLEDNMSITHK